MTQVPARRTSASKPAAGGAGAAAAVERAADSPWIDRLARLGLTARGVIYLLIGALALQLALGNRGRSTDQNGALRTVADQPFGSVLLWLMALGFAGYALWRLTEVAFGETGGDGGVGGRLKCLVRAVAYGSLCFTTVSLVTGAGNARGGSGAQNQELTAKVMEQGWGRVLIGLLGLALVGVGALLVVEGVRRKFLKHLSLQGASASTRRTVERLGAVGTTARGLVFALAGVFVVQAAVTFDPAKARGLDGALKSLLGTPAGPWLLGAVALGLLAFGAYGLAEARYRRTSDEG